MTVAPERSATAGPQRRNVRLEQEAQLGVDQLEPGVEQHAVGVVERMHDPAGILVRDRGEALAPPVVDLERQDQIGRVLADQRQQPVGLAVRHQHVDHQEAQPALGRRRGAGQHLGPPQARVGQNHRELVGEAGEEREHQQLVGPGAGIARDQDQNQDAGEAGRDLQAWEIARPDPPGLVPAERQQRRRDEDGPQAVEDERHGRG